ANNDGRYCAFVIVCPDNYSNEVRNRQTDKRDRTAKRSDTSGEERSRYDDEQARLPQVDTQTPGIQVTKQPGVERLHCSKCDYCTYNKECGQDFYFAPAEATKATEGPDEV